MDITSDHGNNSWKFHDITMKGRWWKKCDGRTDRQTDGQTDGLNQSYSCLVAAKNMLTCLMNSNMKEKEKKWTVIRKYANTNELVLHLTTEWKMILITVLQMLFVLKIYIMKYWDLIQYKDEMMVLRLLYSELGNGICFNLLANKNPLSRCEVVICFIAQIIMIVPLPS